MNCTECKEMLAGYIEGLVEGAERAELEEHLNKCPLCRQELQEFKALYQKLTQSSRNWQQTDIENDVINRVIREQNERLKETGRVNRQLNIWRIIMQSRITKLAAAAVITIAVLVGIGQLFGGSVTFAAVIEPILNARTVVFDFIVGEDETAPVIHEIVAGSRIRRTFSSLEGQIQIIDTDSGKILALNAIDQTAAYINIKGQVQEKTKSYISFVRDVIMKLKDSPDVEELGEHIINGRMAIGFAARSENEEVKIWADPRTVIPIRVEMRVGQFSAIFKNFEFDVPIDESLMSMEVPDGYTLEDKELDFTGATEEEFIESLRIWAEYLMDGRFPEVIGTEHTMKQMPELAAKLIGMSLSEDEVSELIVSFSKGMLFLQKYEMGMAGEWRYLGDGVRLGEADRPVFWYRPDDSQFYRVIYGDLSVEDVSPLDLPK